MSLFQSVDLVRKSFAPGTLVKGSWVNGAGLEPLPFGGTVQPPSGETMRVLPEGTRKSDVIEVIALRDIEFNVADPETGRKSDIIVWQEREYEVIGAVLMDNGLIPHWELIAQRPKEGQA
jgi:hypothetical protein